MLSGGISAIVKVYPSATSAKMIVKDRLYTVEEFQQIAMLPENADRLLEHIGGEIIEVFSNNYASQIAAFIIAAVIPFVLERRLDV